MLRKLAIRGVATFLLILTAAPAAAADFTPQARAAVLLDGDTGQILYQQNGNDRNFPASTTKILAALVAAEHATEDQLSGKAKIKVSAAAVDVPPDSSMCYLQEGEEHELRALLLGLMLVSGNDCANAIAEGVSGGRPDLFIQWMNETAARVGATSSHFTNAHGYHEENHYTTAKDLALISQAAFQNKLVVEVSGTRSFEWPGKSELNGIYYNHNPMFAEFSDTVAGKTGFTEEAGLTLVNTAKRDGRFLVGVIMGATDSGQRNRDMASMLEMGFTEFRSQPIVKKGALFGDVPVSGGVEKTVSAEFQKDFSWSVPAGNSPNITTEAKLNPQVAAPIAAGQNLGVVDVKEDGRLLGKVQLVARADVAVQPSIGRSILAGVLNVLKWILYVIGGLLAFRLTVKGIRRVLRRFRKRNQPSYRPSSQSRGTIDFYRTRSR